jgi:hypothetical protein
MAKAKEYYVRLDGSIIKSPAYRDLKSPARALLIEFLLIFRPTRNGKLTITSAYAMELIKSSDKVTRRAFYELSEHGFIKLKGYQNWQRKKGREFALTFHKINDHEPTNDYLKWGEGKNMDETFNRPKELQVNSVNKNQSTPP